MRWHFKHTEDTDVGRCVDAVGHYMCSCKGSLELSEEFKLQVSLMLCMLCCFSLEIFGKRKINCYMV